MRSDSIWSDKKRHLGMPISFTRYTLTEERLYVESGCFNLKESELLLYRVKDLSLTRSLWQRIFGVGTIHIFSSDVSDNHIDITNVKDSRNVKDLISSKVEEAKGSRRMGTTELLGGPAAPADGGLDC